MSNPLSSAIKFDRNFQISMNVRDGGGDIVIGMPFTCQFAMQRDTQSSLNYLNLQIYNLSPRVRNRIFQDWNDPQRKEISFQIGYGQDLSLVFQGDIFQADSSREGADIITTIEAKEGTFDAATTMTFKTINPTKGGVKVEDVLRALIGDFPNLKPGAISSAFPTVKRPVVLNGNTYDMLKRITGGHVFIDYDKVNCFATDEAISGNVALINASTGLLNTPQRSDAFLRVTTLMEPRIQVGTLVELQSTVTPQYNGQYKVLGIIHEGTISGAVGGRATSTFHLLHPSTFKAFRSVKAV